MRTKPKGRRGPRPLGDRVQFTATYERELLESVAELAEQDGLPVGRVINRLVAQALGKPVPEYCMPKHDSDDQLALAVSA